MSQALSVAEALTDVLTPEEVEREFKIKRGTQAAMRSRRQIPFHRLGESRLDAPKKLRGLIRYSRAELLAWFASKRVTP